MGLFDKAKNLASNAVESARAATSSALEKTGMHKKLGLLNALAFSTDEELRAVYLNRVALMRGVYNVGGNFISGKINEHIEALGFSATVNEYIDKFINEAGENATTEESIVEAVGSLKQQRKALQTELLEVWQNSTIPEELELYEKYKYEDIWIED